MIAPNEHVRIGFGVFFISAPMVVGWAGGRSAHGQRFMRVFSIHAMLAATPGTLGVLLGPLYLIAGPPPPTSTVASPNYYPADRAGLFILSGLLVFIAALFAAVACGAALARFRMEKRRRWFVTLVSVSAIALVLADIFFTLDYLHEEPNRALLLGASVLGAFATLGIAAYAFTSPARQLAGAGARTP